MKIKRRGFLGSLLSFGAFEKTCMAEARVTSPTSLQQNIEYWQIHDSSWQIDAVCQDKSFLENLQWIWTFQIIIDNCHHEALSDDLIDYPAEINEKKMFEFIEHKYKVFFNETNGGVPVSNLPPINEIQNLCKKLGIKPGFVINKFDWRKNGESKPSIIMPDMTIEDLYFENLIIF